jgi:hypothetical protein
VFRTPFACIVAALVACGAPAAAQTPAPAVDVGDLWHAVRHKSDERPDGRDSSPRERFLVAAPTIGSRPSTGLTGGVNGQMAFFSGDAATTHISSISGGVRLSQKGQVLSGVRYSVFTTDDRWFLQGDNRLSWTSLTTYALGALPIATGAENVKYDALRLYETAYRQIKPHLFVGAGINVNAHENIRPGDGQLEPWDESAYLAYNEAHGLPASGQASSGTSVGLVYDTRDNAINAARGSLASATYRTFFRAMGGDSTWQELSFDARTYRALTPDARRKLAFWLSGDFVTGGVAPYFDLPGTANDGRSARGYSDGRYRGEHLLYGEIEYRSTLTRNGLLGYVAFLNATTVSSLDNHEHLFDAWAPAGGGGLRVLLNKRSRTNFCADYAAGKAGSRGFYLAIQEAF